jgi:hypothetical protein
MGHVCGVDGRYAALMKRVWGYRDQKTYVHIWKYSMTYIHIPHLLCMIWIWRNKKKGCRLTNLANFRIEINEYIIRAIGHIY